MAAGACLESCLKPRFRYLVGAAPTPRSSSDRRTPHAQHPRLALAVALLPVAGAMPRTLLQTYQLARAGDPQRPRPKPAGWRRARVRCRRGVAAAAARRHRDGAEIAQQRHVDQHPVRSRHRPAVQFNTRAPATPRRATSVSTCGRWCTTAATSPASRARTRWARPAISSCVPRRLAGDAHFRAYFNVLVAIETLAAAEAQETSLKKQFDFASKRRKWAWRRSPTCMKRVRSTRVPAPIPSSPATRSRMLPGAGGDHGHSGASLKGLPMDFQPTLPPSMISNGWVAAAIANNPALRAKQLQVQATEVRYRDGARGLLADALPQWQLRRQQELRQQHVPRADAAVRPLQSRPGGRPDAQRADLFRRGHPVARASGTRPARPRQRPARATEGALVRNTPTPTRRWWRASARWRRGGWPSWRTQRYSASQVVLEVGTRTVLDVLNNQQTLFNAERVLHSPATISCKAGCCSNRQPDARYQGRAGH